jgi:hypothetical protein
MEVHHHPHVEKKKFKEYFLEFLMIFLAVTLGFFAENIREYVNERAHECNLMKMFVQDLSDDIIKLDSSIDFNTSKVSYLDTLKNLSIAAANNRLSNERYRMMYYIYVAYGYNDYPFQPSKRTLDQFEKSDAFNVIRKQKVSDSIRLYSENNNYINDQHAIFLEAQNQEHQVGETIFNISLFNYCAGSREAYKILQSDNKFQLLTNDRNALLLYASRLYADRGVLVNSVYLLKFQKEAATRLISLIQQEYNLKDK